MTSFQLKLWACLFMLVDHIGVVFFDDNLAMRAIGRLSMPIFAFLLVEGSRTHNLVNYLAVWSVGTDVATRVHVCFS